MASHRHRTPRALVAIALACLLCACAGGAATGPGTKAISPPLAARNGGGLAEGWSVKLSGAPGLTRRIALHGSVLVLLAQTPNTAKPARQLFGFDRASGELLWSHDHPLTDRFGRDRVLSAPGRVIYFSNTGVFALDSATGELRWTFDPGGRELTQAFRVGELLVLAADDTLVVLEAETGRWVRGIDVSADDSREPGLVLEGTFENAQGPHALISQRLIPRDALPDLPPQVTAPGRRIVLRAVALLGEGGATPEPPFAKADVAWHHTIDRQRCDMLAAQGAVLVSCNRNRVVLYDPDEGQRLYTATLIGSRANPRASGNGMGLLAQVSDRERWQGFLFDKQPGPRLLGYKVQPGFFLDTLRVRAWRARDGALAWERFVPTRAPKPTLVLRPAGLGALVLAFERLVVVMDEDTGELLEHIALDTRERGAGWFAADADAQAFYALQRRGGAVYLSAVPLRRPSRDEPDDDEDDGATKPKR